MEPTYSEYEPPSDIVNFVHCIWSFQDGDGTDVQPIIPDGRPELIIHLGAPYREVGKASVQPRALLAGQLTQPLHLQATGPVDIIGVRFRPDGARAFLGHTMEQTTNLRIDMSAVDTRGIEHLYSTLQEKEKSIHALKVVEDYVSSRIHGAQPDPIVRRTVDQVTNAKKYTLPSEISRRQFQRRFKAQVGVSSRTFIAIRRFRSIFDRMQHKEGLSWAHAALDAGYFDQPQLARDFQRFLGCTAREWAEQSLGLARAIGGTNT